MSFWKKVLIGCAAGVAVFAALLVYALTDTVRDVTEHSALRRFSNAPQTLKRPGFLVQRAAHEYRFTENELTAETSSGSRLIASLPPGTTIIVHRFKTYTNAVSGFTSLYAVGTVAVAGNPLDFEYRWSGLDVLDATSASVELSHALWQDSTSAKTVFIKKE